MELWQQAAEWLRECIPLDSSVHFQRPEDFAAFLKDGFALCALANRLSNGCVAQVRRNYNTGTSQFISESNLALFLNACRSTFGIAEKDLFRVEDLSDLEDFSRVLKLISLLSRSRHAEMLGISPFPHGISRRTSHHSLELPDDEAEIYMELHTKPTVDDAALKFETNFDIYGTDHNDEIYNSFVYQPTSRIVSRYADFRPNNKREHCMKELLDTEINYCDTLKMIIDHFYTPMGVILDSDTHKTIFINVYELHVLHAKFLDKLRKSILISFGVNKSEENDQTMRVPEIFLRFKLDFLKYTDYCACLEASRSEIANIELNKPDVNKRVEEYRAKAGKQNVKLGDILTVPMQRILKYHLLLKQLLDTTPPNDEEIRMWDEAYESMKDVSDYVNEGKRDHEIMGIIRMIQSKIPNFPSEDQWLQYGRLLQDGQVKVLDSNVGQKYKSRYVFLFEKVLLICKNKDEDIRSTYSVSNFKVVEPEQESQLNRASNTLTRKLTTSLFEHTSLMVLVKDSCVLTGDAQPYLQFTFRSTQVRDKWREMIERAIDKNNPPNAKRLRHKVTYQSYPRPTECSVCNKLLLGLFYQGYHCQTCNKDMHFDCIDLGQTICRQSTSTIHRSNSSTTHILMQPQPRFESGDRVQALQNVNSADNAVLSFQKGDFIEVVRENEDGSLTGRLPNSPQKLGVLSRDSVTKISRSHSLVGNTNIINNNNHSPRPQQQSPMRTIDPNISRLSVSAMADQADRRPSLVSSEIIALFDTVKNMTVEQYPWYFGPLERNEAKLHLGNNPDGTFLVRQSRNQSQYVLSVLYDNNDKHILIEMDSNSHLYYLHGARYFHNIPSLINYYRSQSLEEGFNDLFTTLNGTPLKNTNFRAVHPYTGPQTESTPYLKLERGDTVKVLDTNGEANGWWKGMSKGVTGYFPLAYVEEMDRSAVDVEIRNGDTFSTEVY